MSDFILRKAIQKDAIMIRRLARSGGVNPTRLNWPRFTVAETDGVVIGCVQLKPHKDGSVELGSLVVAKSWQGRGVARALIEEMIGIHQGVLYLMCLSTVGPLYEKFGFSVLELDEMPNHFHCMYHLGNMIEKIRLRGNQVLIMSRNCP